MRLEDRKGVEGRLLGRESMLNELCEMSTIWEERFVDFRKGNVIREARWLKNPVFI